ncbi:NAD(P)H-dependent oxidoreductase [Furfurilactobacillus curtus]|uniref:Oxidoreductase n=1 Tax=Furfurilactobacillus curtus TaxID=1746200 RepID=A0ABQ5JQU1_9LACO
MKLVGIVGSVADVSYNRILMKFIASHFSDQVDVEILDINDIPMFDQENNQTNGEPIQYLNKKILAADGVIIATPEHNHTLTPALKNVIEWLSYEIHPFSGKPVMIVGASFYDQGSSRAQLMLRQILESPGVNAVVFPGNEFLLANVKSAFDEQGNLKDGKTVAFLGSTLSKFVQFVKVINLMNEPQSGEEEDLTASGSISTTVAGVDMAADDWLEQAAMATQAAEGDQYVKLDRGLLTVDQLNAFLNTMPMELTYADSNNQFIYYNKMTDNPKAMLAPRRPGQVGDPMSMVHPPRAVKHVAEVINALRTDKTDLVKMPVPGNGPDRFIMHYYKAMRDGDHKYLGINEWVLDLMPTIRYYLQATGQKLTPDPNAHPDAVAGASEQPTTPVGRQTDATAGASEEIDTPANPAPAVDGTSGASEA